MDLSVVPTISFQLLYGMLILQRGRCEILWSGVTMHPSSASASLLSKLPQSNRTHFALNKDSPVSRAVETVGRILPVPILGGLHHRYVRI
jgi:hypothetical protein